MIVDFGVPADAGDDSVGLADTIGSRLAFPALAIGSAVGALAMRRLARGPIAVRGAGGRG